MNPLIAAAVVGFAYTVLLIFFVKLAVKKAVKGAVTGAEERLGISLADLRHRIADVHLVTPQTPGVQGTVSARLFEAMKDVCEAGRQEHLCEQVHETLKKSPGAMQGEVDRVYGEYFERMRARKAAVERYVRIMVEQPKKPEA